MPQRIFILGEQGQVARALAKAYSARGDTYTCVGRSSINITDHIAVSDAVAAYKANLLVNAAAYTQVDRAEDDRHQAFAVNRDGARNAATAARLAKIPLIHISSDYVFDGDKKSPYVETDTPNPRSVYGESKFAGEAAIANENEDYLILRTSWVYSAGGLNFMRAMLRLAGEREEIRVVDDQHGCPTLADDLAAAIVKMGDICMAGRGTAREGLYHVAGTGATTWCGFATAIMTGSQERGGPASRVRPITTREFPTRAVRPANSRLDCSKAAKVFGIRLPRWEASLDMCLDQLLPAAQGSPK